MSGEIRIWQLTELGTRAARNPGNPQTPAYQIIGFLDMMGSGTTDQIASSMLPDENSGKALDYGGVSIELNRLKRLGVVREVTGGQTRI